MSNVIKEHKIIPLIPTLQHKDCDEKTKSKVLGIRKRCIKALKKNKIIFVISGATVFAVGAACLIGYALSQGVNDIFVAMDTL